MGWNDPARRRVDHGRSANPRTGGDLRGFQLHLWKKRGVFKNMVTRHYGPNRTIPEKPIFSALELRTDEIAEIDFRFEALKPYLKPNPPRFESAAK